MTLRRELADAWMALRHAHPDARFYSYGLYTTDELDYLMVTASTEEGLRAVTEKYVDRDGGSPQLTALSLRWSPCDSPLHVEGDRQLKDSQRALELRTASLDDDEFEEMVDVVLNLAVDALRELDAEGHFGSESDRERLVLGIWKGDQSNEERIAFARRLNPDTIAERFAHEVEAGTAAFFELTSDAG